MKWSARYRSLFAAAAAIAVAVVAIADIAYVSLQPPPLDRGRDVSVLVLARDGSILRGFLSHDGKWRLPTRPQDVDPLYRKMLVTAEDARFYEHPGVDPLAALRAFGQLVWHRHIVSGASTLTMQVVRLLQRHPRSLAAKLADMGKALALERRLSKQQILGLYLTLAPFGGNLEGVRAASLAYFAKEPAQLSAAEAALLVALPRSPERLRPDRHPEAAERARDRVLARMAAAGVISVETLAEARAEPVPQHRHPMPFRAPHLARALRDENPAVPVRHTTIDPLLQMRIEALLRRQLDALPSAATLAAIVVDNKSRAVLAYVGNAEFASVARHGTIDMARAVRSPGSAMKPILYALAFDRMILHPETILEDKPTQFAGYAPSDFDGRFQGEVSAREALQYSLNVPAVAVMEHLGPARFTAALAAAGVRLHLPSQDVQPGLAIALGGAGIRLVDLVRLYLALSNGGAVAPLRFEVDQPPGPATQIFGPVAAWYVGDILIDAPPPPGLLPDQVRQGRHLAFKTGTSYGFRDSWAVGWDAQVTIGVWAGRADGTPVPGTSGRTTAAPAMFAIADLLGPAAMSGRPGPPPGALVVPWRDLPPRLQRLAPGPLPGAEPAISGPHILYPPNEALIEWRGDDLPLEATGGRPPLRWVVDGRPLPAGEPRRTQYWHPDGIGFVRLTVIDGAGISAHSTVRLAPPP
jgi:penicillin-binding protein 1C